MNSKHIALGVLFTVLTRRGIMGFLAKVLAFFSGETMQKIYSCIPQIVQEVEKAMADGKITAEERKQLAIDAITIIANKFNVKLNPIQQWLVSILIDKISQALPSKDINVSSTITNIIKG